MRDAPGNVGPGGAALVAQLVGDVVEGQDRHHPRSARASPPASAALRPNGPGHRPRAASPAMNSSSSAETSASVTPFELPALVLQQASRPSGWSAGCRPSASSAMTPAVTLDSTASMKARRVSSCCVGGHQRAGLFLQAPVIRLKAVAKRLDLVLGLGRTGDPGGEVALLDPPRGSRPVASTGRTRRSASFRAAKMASADDDQRAEPAAPR